MRINILSTIGNKPGGLNRILLTHANQLALNGHEVRVIKPVIKSFRKGYFYTRAKKFVYFGFRPRRKPYRCRWMRCAANLYVVPFCSDSYISDADVTIFSSLNLRSSVTNLSSKKGKKILMVQDPHFIQSPLSIPEKITVIAVSSFIKKGLLRWLGRRKVYLLENGIDLNLFSNPKKIFRPAKIIGMMFYGKRPTRKGMEDGIAAFEAVRKKYPYLELWMVGLKKEKWIPNYIRFFKGADQQKLADFYRLVDIFLFPSHLEACTLVPMEAMASKCAVVTTDVGGIADYAIAGKTALVSPPKSIEGLIENLRLLLEKPEKVKEIALAGYENIKKFSQEEQTLKLERIISDIV